MTNKIRFIIDNKIKNCNFKLPLKINGKNNEINIIGFSKKHKLKNLNIIINGDNNKITIPINTMYKNCNLEIYNDNCIVVFPESCWFDNVNISMEKPGKQTIIFGNNTTSNALKIKMTENTNIEIGEDCMFGRGVEIQSSDFHSIYDMDDNLLNSNKDNTLKIGDHCWITNFSILTKGAKLPNNTIVGTSSIVTKSFTEENTIIAGNPAKIIKNNVKWGRERPGQGSKANNNNVLNNIKLEKYIKKIKLLEFIPFLKIEKTFNETKFFLFNFLYILSIKNK